MRRLLSCAVSRFQPLFQLSTLLVGQGSADCNEAVHRAMRECGKFPYLLVHGPVQPFPVGVVEEEAPDNLLTQPLVILMDFAAIGDHPVRDPADLRPLLVGGVKASQFRLDVPLQLLRVM